MKDLISKINHKKIYHELNHFTMIPKKTYLHNLELAKSKAGIAGSVVECGTWKGGMIAGIAKILGNQRDYYLYDSFEGLPEAKKIDGEAALTWQMNKADPGYHNNCSAKYEDAEEAMKKSGAKHYKIIKGWFEHTLPHHPQNDKISILRLDGDWYESTLTCLNHFFAKVVPGGLIIIDDYKIWEGCTKAVHDFLSREKRPEGICQYNNTVTFVEKV
jgi:O-methyltransferase